MQNAERSEATVNGENVSIETVSGATENEVYKTGTGSEYQYQIMNTSAIQQKVILRKVAEDTNKPLDGAQFRIFRADMTEITEGQPTGKTYYESSDSGVYFIGTLPRGLYYLVETKAPTGANSSNQGKVFELRVEDKMVRQIKTGKNINSPGNDQVLKALSDKVK